jgi:ParB-like nuclease domain
MEIIQIDSIDRTDTRFCVSFPLEDPVLFKSIDAFGVRMPLLLLDTAPYTVVTGFRRLHAASGLGLKSLPCSIRSMNEKDALLTALNDNITRPLNMVEAALGVDKMSRMGFRGEEIYAMMKLFGLEAHDKLLKNLLEIARTDDATKQFLVKQRANMTHVELILAFDSVERTELIALLSGMHVTSSQLREILQLLLLVKLKEGRILFKEYSHCETTDAFKLVLKKRTHPGLSILEQQLRQVLEKTALPSWISVKVDPFFEREWIDIDIRAHGVEDVQEAIKDLDNLVRNGSLRSIFELTNGTRRN